MYSFADKPEDRGNLESVIYRNKMVLPGSNPSLSDLAGSNRVRTIASPQPW
jgi:hypothetical protein